MIFQKKKMMIQWWI